MKKKQRQYAYGLGALLFLGILAFFFARGTFFYVLPTTGCSPSNNGALSLAADGSCFVCTGNLGSWSPTTYTACDSLRTPSGGGYTCPSPTCQGNVIYSGVSSSGSYTSPFPTSGICKYTSTSYCSNGCDATATKCYVPTCTDQCVVGAQSCIGNALAVCDRVTNGCLTIRNLGLGDCPYGCSNGHCNSAPPTPSCTDFCNPGEVSVCVANTQGNCLLQANGCFDTVTTPCQYGCNANGLTCNNAPPNTQCTTNSDCGTSCYALCSNGQCTQTTTLPVSPCAGAIFRGDCSWDTTACAIQPVDVSGYAFYIVLGIVVIVVIAVAIKRR